MRIPRIMVAGTHSGVGKTTVAVALMAALKRRGFVVQGFKAGPDYIDPGYHTAVTGRPSRNLDTWMTGSDGVLEILERGSRGSEISVIEGVMGYYDGKDVDSLIGSTAEVAQLTASPVLLVVDVSGMAQSVAAVVKGFKSLDATGRIVGVLANRVGSEGHYAMVKRAIEALAHVPVVGYMSSNSAVEMPERHLGLLPAIERGELTPLWDRLASAVEKTVNLDQIVKWAQMAGPPPSPGQRVFSGIRQPATALLAVARDAAFNFYYPENLELLGEAGLEIREFSPLAGEPLPSDADALYLGGGFPEEYLRDLSQPLYLNDVRNRLALGLPTVAECGGYMYLGDAIQDHEGTAFPMVSSIPIRTTMQQRLVALGYREVLALVDNPILTVGQKARGHEFHYSSVEFLDGQEPSAYMTQGWRRVGRDGVARAYLTAGYTHLHFFSNPSIAERLHQFATAYRSIRQTRGT
ncbi:MAG: cobyrinate a,c-diamide synthase [Sulfobacillus sp.]